MREAIKELTKVGQLPSSDDSDDELLKKISGLIASIHRPISDDEARALVKLFGEDDCFGLAWTLLHLIESAPGWPLEDCLTDHGNE
jgi:hypothetical protein